MGFVSVAVFVTPLVLPTSVFPHDILAERLTNPARLVPLSDTDCGLVEEFEATNSVPVCVPSAEAV